MARASQSLPRSRARAPVCPGGRLYLFSMPRAASHPAMANSIPGICRKSRYQLVML